MAEQRAPGGFGLLLQLPTEDTQVPVQFEREAVVRQRQQAATLAQRLAELEASELSSGETDSDSDVAPLNWVSCLARKSTGGAQMCDCSHGCPRPATRRMYRLCCAPLTRVHSGIECIAELAATRSNLLTSDFQCGRQSAVGPPRSFQRRFCMLFQAYCVLGSVPNPKTVPNRPCAHRAKKLLNNAEDTRRFPAPGDRCSWGGSAAAAAEREQRQSHVP